MTSRPSTMTLTMDPGSATDVPSTRKTFIANEHLPIESLGRMWLVTEGSVEVFIVRILDGEPVGPRRWLFTAPSGTALFAVPAADQDGLVLLAVAASDGVLAEIHLDQLRAAAQRSADTRKWAAEVMETWLVAVGAAVARFEEAQIADFATPGSPLSVAAERRIGTNGVAWVTHRSGHSWFTGRGGMIALKESTPPFPLAAGSWIMSRAPVELDVASTLDVISADPEWDGFEFYRVLLSGWTSASERSAEVAERERRLRRAAANQQMKSSAIVRLMGTITRSPVGQEATTTTNADALLAACRAIGKREGIDFIPPQQWEIDEGIRNPLGAICVASRVRTRRVALRGSWWTRDSGSILVRYKEGRVPLAALRERNGKYALHHPFEGTTIPMTAEVAETLEPFGVAFYRPLPDTPITTGGLIRFVLTGMTGSLWSIAFIAILGGALGLFMPIATGFVFQQVIPSSMHSQLWQVFFGLTIAALSAQTFELVRAFAISRLNGRSATAMQSALFDRLLQLPAPFFQRHTIGDLVSRVNGVSQVRQLLSSGAITAMLSGLTGILNFGLLFYFAPILAWVAAGFAAVSCAIIFLLSWRAKRLQDTIQEITGKLAGLVFQLVSGVAKLRVSGAEDRALAMWAQMYVEKVKLANRASDANGLVLLVTNALPLLASIVTFGVVGALQNGNNAIAVSTFIAFNSAMGAFLAAAIAMSTTFVNMVQIAPLMKRASVILLEKPELGADRPNPGRLTGRIEGRNLSFRYRADGPVILHNLSFYAEPGEFIALVGPSGSGKSTVLRMLLGFETPENGAVYYDGQDLSTIDVGAVRRQMGVVLQSSRLMAGDIFTNIVGSSPLTQDDAWEAAEMAGFADDIRDMPMQMHTVISDGGSTLSGGQRQRLLIARSLVHKPRMILFDEATSALDNRTQRIVTESLDRMHATRVVIAHRLSTIQNADRVYVIDAGKVVEWGHPTDLLAKDGVFAKLAARQLA